MVVSLSVVAASNLMQLSVLSVSESSSMLTSFELTVFCFGTFKNPDIAFLL